MSKNQYGFMLRKTTMEPKFCLRQSREKYREKKEICQLYIQILKRSDNKVLREAVLRVLGEKGVLTVYIKTIQDMYDEARIYVKYVCREPENCIEKFVFTMDQL